MQRRRHRHRARASAAADRALLPRRRQPLARDRRHRAWACRSSSTWCSAMAASSRCRERARAGFDVSRLIFPPARGCAARASGAAAACGRVNGAVRRPRPCELVAVGRPRSTERRAHPAVPAVAAASTLAPARVRISRTGQSERRPAGAEPDHRPCSRAPRSRSRLSPGAATQAPRPDVRRQRASTQRLGRCARSRAAAATSVISSSQHRATPPAGSTRLFQSASRWRPVRQCTSASQATLPARPAPGRRQSKLGIEARAPAWRHWRPAAPARRSAWQRR